MKSTLAAVLSSRGVRARIANLLRESGYTFKFDAGKLVIDWYYVPKPPQHSKHRKTKMVLVASASETIKKAGETKVKIKLKARGRALLQHAKRQRLTVQARFTPIGESTATSSTVITLKP